MRTAPRWGPLFSLWQPRDLGSWLNRSYNVKSVTMPFTGCLGCTGLSMGRLGKPGSLKGECALGPALGSCQDARMACPINGHHQQDKHHSWARRVPATSDLRGRPVFFIFETFWTKKAERTKFGWRVHLTNQWWFWYKDLSSPFLFPRCHLTYSCPVQILRAGLMGAKIPSY